MFPTTTSPSITSGSAGPTTAALLSGLDTSSATLLAAAPANPRDAARQVVKALYPGAAAASQTERRQIAALENVIEKRVLYDVPDDRMAATAQALTRSLAGLSPAEAMRRVNDAADHRQSDAWKGLLGGIADGLSEVGQPVVWLAAKVVEFGQKFNGSRPVNDTSMDRSLAHSKQALMDFLGIRDDALFRDGKRIGETASLLAGALSLGKGVLTLAREGPQVLLELRVAGSVAKHLRETPDATRLAPLVEHLLKSPEQAAAMSPALRSELASGLAELARTGRPDAAVAQGLLGRLERSPAFRQAVKEARAAHPPRPALPPGSNDVRGRAAFQSPQVKPGVDRRLAGKADLSDPSRQAEVALQLEPYLESVPASAQRLARTAEHFRRRAASAGAAEGFQRMTDAEIFLLEKYTGTLAKPLNGAARQDFQAGGSVFRQTVRGGPDDGNYVRLTVQARQIISRALAKLPDHAGQVFRGVDLPPGELGKMVPGGVVQFPGILSSSMQERGAFHKSVLFVIQGRHGKDVSGLSSMVTEHEVLFDHASRFQVTGRKILNDGRVEIRMREL